jgi:dienelactone hydrolase
MRLLFRLIGRLFGAVFGLFSGVFSGRDPAPVLTEGPVAEGVFRDRGRKRDILFRLYSPEGVEGPAPVVIFSHGLGGSREAAPYLGHALAQNGYYAFFIQHPGSDSSILAGARGQEEVLSRMRQATVSPGNARDRFGDVPFVLDQLAEMNRDSRLAGKLDLDRIGIAGHSYGARTVLTLAGQRGAGYGLAFKDARIKAGVPLSPNIPTGPGQGLGMSLGQNMGQNMDSGASLAGIYDAIDIPLLHVTGTLDGMPLGNPDFRPETRTLPFQHIPFSPQYLLVLAGATHNTFSSRLSGGREDMADMRHTQTVATAVVLFFDAYLKGDDEALEVLHDGFRYGLAPEDMFVFK